MQTGTAHGGFVNADGTVRMDVKIDLVTLEELSRAGPRELRPGRRRAARRLDAAAEAFDAFPRVGACEIHLATDFQNMVYDHPQFPADAQGRDVRVGAREREGRAASRSDTEEQFLYKARKKAIGPFKSQAWNLPAEVRAAIGKSLEDQFAFLMGKLRINGTSAVIAEHITPAGNILSLEASRKAAAGTITLEERKAEGLSD